MVGWPGNKASQTTFLVGKPWSGSASLSGNPPAKTAQTLGTPGNEARSGGQFHIAFEPRNY